MQIAIIGSGNIGGALAAGLAKQKHHIILGARNTSSPDIEALTKSSKNITAATVADAVAQSDVIIIAVPLAAVPEVAKSLGNIKGKLVIETTNAFGKPLPKYINGTAAIKEITGNDDVVKCFNSIGAENLSNPKFGNFVADTFVAGNSKKAKGVAIKLVEDMGFGNCFDIGGDEALPILENIAQLWGKLAYSAQLGRRLAFKVLY